MSHTKLFIALSVVLVAAVLKLINLGGMNFAPIGAIAVFCGLTFRNKWLAFGLPLLATLAGDVALAIQNGNDFGTYLFSPIMLFVYAGWGLYACCGFGIRKIWSKTETVQTRTLSLCGGSLLGSVAFFIVTNLGVWCVGSIHTVASLVKCFVDAIPFFQKTVASDMIYLAAIMTVYTLATHFVANKQAAQSPLLYTD